MPKKNSWKEVFRSHKGKAVGVRVAGKVEEMTSTQAVRFEDLMQKRLAESALDSVPESVKAGFSIEESAKRLKISVADLFEKSSAGLLSFYIDATGIAGHWRRPDAAYDTAHDSAQMVVSGYLALPSQLCGDMGIIGSVLVHFLEYRSHSNPSATDLDTKTLATLASLGEGEKLFYLDEPMWVDPKHIVLLDP